MRDQRGRAKLVVAIVTLGLCPAATRADVVCTYSREFNLRIPASASASKGWMDDATIDIPSHLIITDLDITIDVTHTNIFDLTICLQSPSGTTVRLIAYDAHTEFFKGANYANTTFDDEASTFIKDGSAPFAGSYRPVDALSAFDGEDACGLWRLSILDNYKYDTGRFKGLTLDITVPEPATLVLLALGLLAARRRSFL